MGLIVFWILAVIAFISLSTRTRGDKLVKPIIAEQNARLLDRFQTDCKNADITPTSANFVIWLETHGYIIIDSEITTTDGKKR